MSAGVGEQLAAFPEHGGSAARKKALDKVPGMFNKFRFSSKLATEMYPEPFESTPERRICALPVLRQYGYWLAVEYESEVGKNADRGVAYQTARNYLQDLVQVLKHKFGHSHEPETLSFFQILEDTGEAAEEFSKIKNNMARSIFQRDVENDDVLDRSEGARRALSSSLCLNPDLSCRLSPQCRSGRSRSRTSSQPTPGSTAQRLRIGSSC
jgi:hypothetical protein